MITSSVYVTYYRNPILFEIVKQLLNHETSFLSPKYPIRCIKAHSIDYLKRNMEALGFWRRPYNIYRSLAHLKDMPTFSYEPSKRREQQQEFNKSFMEYTVGYDLAFDFDSKQRGFQQCYKDAGLLKKYFDDYGIPYTIKMSGSGFHIEVLDEYLPGDVEKVKYCTFFVNEISEVFNLPTLDTSIIDWRRLWKVAYSLDINTGNVVLPLTDEQFRKFNKRILRPENCINIQGRGMLRRDGTSKNLQRFYENYILSGVKDNEKS